MTLRDQQRLHDESIGRKGGKKAIVAAYAMVTEAAAAQRSLRLEQFRTRRGGTLVILLHRQAATKLDGLNTTQMRSAREDGLVCRAASLCSALLPTVSCDVQSVQAQAVAWDALWDIEAGDHVHLLDAYLQADRFGHRNTKRNEGQHVSVRGKTKRRHGFARSTSLTQGNALDGDQCGQYGCPASS